MAIQQQQPRPLVAQEAVDYIDSRPRAERGWRRSLQPSSGIIEELIGEYNKGGSLLCLVRFISFVYTTGLEEGSMHTTATRLVFENLEMATLIYSLGVHKF